MDASTEKHLNDWIKATIHRDEAKSIKTKITKLLEEYPELIEKGWSWPDMRRAVECKYDHDYST